jgi:hypothetical protein
VFPLVSVGKAKAVIIQMALQMSQAQGKSIMGDLYICFNPTIIGLKEDCVQKRKTYIEREMYIYLNRDKLLFNQQQQHGLQLLF